MILKTGMEITMKLVSLTSLFYLTLALNNLFADAKDYVAGLAILPTKCIDETKQNR